MITSNIHTGTILFYENQDVVSGLQEQMPNYYDNFAIWSTQTNAMHQFAIWTALATKGIGASLQHYNPLVDEMTSNEFNIPKVGNLLLKCHLVIFVKLLAKNI